METIFKKVAKKINKSLINEISQKIFSQNRIESYIIEEIQSRLYNNGIDANNKHLRTNRGQTLSGNGFYSNTTVKIKSLSNQVFKHVTLNDSGHFYKTFELNASKTFYQIKANFKKPEGDIQDNFSLMYNDKEFDNAILNMNENETNTFIKELFIPYFVQNLKIELWQIINQAK